MYRSYRVSLHSTHLTVNTCKTTKRNLFLQQILCIIPYNFPHFWKLFQKQIPLQFYIIYDNLPLFSQTINGSSIPTFIFSSLAFGGKDCAFLTIIFLISGMGITSSHLLKHYCTQPKRCDKHKYATKYILNGEYGLLSDYTLCKTSSADKTPLKQLWNACITTTFQWLCIEVRYMFHEEMVQPSQVSLPVSLATLQLKIAIDFWV